MLNDRAHHGSRTGGAPVTDGGALVLMHATLYVGDQLARIADLLEQTTSPCDHRGDKPAREVNVGWLNVVTDRP